MAKYCVNCGTQMEDDALFCPACGAPVAQAQQSGQVPPQSDPGYQQTPPQGDPGYQQTPPQGNPGYQQVPPQGNPGYQQYAPNGNGFMPDHTAQYHPQDIANNKAMGILSYIGILVLIPFFAEKNSPWVRFHAVQGMYLFLCEIALSIISAILGAVKYVSIGTYFIFGAIQWIISLAILAYVVLGIVFAATGKAKELPLVGKLMRLGWFK